MGVESNLEEMEEAIETVRTGRVTEAVRGVTLNGVTVEPGMLVGMLERKVVAAGDDVGEVMMSLVEAARPEEGGLVTLYRGAPLGADAASRIAGEIETAFGEAEVELVDGGQPHYHFLVAVE